MQMLKLFGQDKPRPKGFGEDDGHGPSDRNRFGAEYHYPSLDKREAERSAKQVRDERYWR